MKIKASKIRFLGFLKVKFILKVHSFIQKVKVYYLNSLYNKLFRVYYCYLLFIEHIPCAIQYVWYFYTYYLCIFHNHSERYGYNFPIYVEKTKI